MKRILSVVLFLVITINCLCVNSMSVLADSGDEAKDITLTMYSNLSSDQYISGIYYKDDFLVTCETICSIAGGNIDRENAEELEFSLSSGQRVFFIDKTKKSVAERFFSDSRKLDVPVLLTDGKVYISVLSFLEYIGATTMILRDAPIQFWVFKHYDFYDAINDYLLSVKTNYFWWDEVETDGDIRNRLINSGVVALINRDSSILRMIVDADGIQQEAVEDALVTILKNEGQTYAADEISTTDIIDLENRVIGRMGDVVEVASAISELIEKDPIFKKVLKGTASVYDKVGDISTRLSNYAQVAETALQLASVSETQRMLLQKTIIDNGESSYTLKTSWSILRDAANNVNERVKSEHSRNFGAASDFFYKEAYELFHKAVGGNPVSLAWEFNDDLLRIIPFANTTINNKTQLYNSYNASMIQAIANEILYEQYSDWYYGNMLCDESKLDYAYEKMESVLYAMILQTKATMTARDYLIQSNYLEADHAEDMKKQIVELAGALNKLENCKVSNIANKKSANTDLSWMASYTEASDLPTNNNSSPGKDTEVYKSIVDDLLKQYGEFRISPWLSKTEDPNGASREANGVCYLRLIDFDNDGESELYAVCKNENDEEYIGRVYSAKNGIKPIFETKVNSTLGYWNQNIELVRKNDKQYYVYVRHYQDGRGGADTEKLYGYKPDHSGHFSYTRFSSIEELERSDGTWHTEYMIQDDAVNGEWKAYDEAGYTSAQDIWWADAAVEMSLCVRSSNGEINQNEMMAMIQKTMQQITGIEKTDDTEKTTDKTVSSPDIESMDSIAGAVIFHCVLEDLTEWNPSVRDTEDFWNVMRCYANAEKGIYELEPPRTGDNGEFMILPNRILVNAGYACFPDFDGVLPSPDYSGDGVRIVDQNNTGLGIADTIQVTRASYVTNEDRSIDAIYSLNGWENSTDYSVHMTINPNYDKANDYFTYYYTIDRVEAIGQQSDSNTQSTEESPKESTEESSKEQNTPFYGIWCGASKDEAGAESIASSLRGNGLDAQIFITTDWSNLNTERWYVISAGTYNSEEEAEQALPQVKAYYENAYIKYSGEWVQ